MKFSHSSEAALEIALKIQSLTKPSVQEPTASLVHTTTDKSNWSDLESRLSKLEVMFEQLVLKQLRQYECQGSYDNDLSSANSHDQFQEEEIWDNGPGEYDGELAGNYDPRAEFEVRGTNNSNSGW